MKQREEEGGEGRKRVRTEAAQWTSNSISESLQVNERKKKPIPSRQGCCWA